MHSPAPPDGLHINKWPSAPSCGAIEIMDTSITISKASSVPQLLLLLTCLYTQDFVLPPPFGCLLGFEQAVRGVDNLLLTLSLNKVWACCHKDSGGQREAGFCAQPWPRGCRGHRLGWQIVPPHTPVTLAPQSSACLTACLASPGINGVQGSRRTQKILYISLKKFAFLFKAVQFYIGLCLVW